jgi:Methyltransferase domain
VAVFPMRRCNAMTVAGLKSPALRSGTAPDMLRAGRSRRADWLTPTVSCVCGSRPLLTERILTPTMQTRGSAASLVRSSPNSSMWSLNVPFSVGRRRADLAPRLSEQQPDLDAGCDSGLMLVPLRAAGLELVGTDIDVDMVATAQSREPRLRGHTFFADPAALAVRRSGFGSVYVAHVFQLFGCPARPRRAAACHPARRADRDQPWPGPPATV